MRIYSMTATFGKLEHETLTLEPGMNVIQAPNEWGKSTWCAFLVNMLYGIDTKARSGGAILVDKERYAPWSGSPMSGRIELNWDGRDITIERRTKGRSIFGDFKAYETETGIEVEELTAANCGQILLGVERGVFTRAGFLRLKDLPVTQDDALRRRLNNLVTTGDESGAGDQLAKTLKDLKNKCRYNQSGLLPQAENEREQLRRQLDTIQSLQTQTETIRERQAQLEQEIAALENHQVALRYEAAQDDARRVTQAQEAAAQAKQTLDALQAASQTLVCREEATQALETVKQLQQQWSAMQLRTADLPPKPQQPPIPHFYQDISDPVAAAREDLALQSDLEAAKKRQAKLVWLCPVFVAVVLGLCTALHLGAVASLPWPLFGGIAAILSIIVTGFLCATAAKKRASALQTVYDRHPGLSTELWIPHAQEHVDQQSQYQAELAAYLASAGALAQQQEQLQQTIKAFAGEQTLDECRIRYEQSLEHWNALDAAQREYHSAGAHAEALQAMVKPAPAPTQPDALDLSEQETQLRLENARFEQKQLQLKLGQSLGQSEALGQENVLRARLDTLNRRISRLEDTYFALEMAQNALRNAISTLQRRFAPKISKRAQELFCRLTEGRYQQISLGEDLSLSARAENENTSYSSQWRSDGTVDQLYLALRLAVAEELTPNAPLVLDDALVRFDDDRLKTALAILQEEAQQKQVIVFTCQNREKSML